MRHAEGYVLLVEDDEHVGATVTMVLEYEGLAVRWARDLDRATRFFDAQRPEVILLDYFLGGETPQSFVRHVRSHNGKEPVPIILLTAATGPEVLAETLRVNRLVRKPCTVEHLIGAVNSCRHR